MASLDISNLKAFPQLGGPLCKQLPELQEDEMLFGKVRTDATQVPDGDDGICPLDDDASDDEDYAVVRRSSKSSSLTTSSSQGNLTHGGLFLKDFDAVDKSPWASPVGLNFCNGFGLDEDGASDFGEEPAFAKEALPEKVVLSVGSEGHGGGDCKPCAWFWKPQGCQNGRDCLHCHLCPKSEVKARKKAKARERKDQEQEVRESEEDAQEAALVNFRPPPGLAPPPGLEAPQLLRCALEAQEADAEDDEVLASGRQPGTSMGSALHSSGLCKPCAWYWKAKGCENGEDCLHCHLCLLGEVKRRRKQKKASASTEQQAPAAPVRTQVVTQIQQQQMLIQQQQQQLLQMQLQLQVQEQKMRLIAGNQAQMQMAAEFPGAFCFA